MLALTPIAERLRACKITQVEGVLEMAAVKTAPRMLPAYFIVPSAESAQDNKLAGARDQLVTAGWSVIVVVDAAQRRADGVHEGLKSAVDAVVDALTGWKHPAASAASDYAGGRLISAAGSTVEWEVKFKARYHLRKPT